MNQQPSPTFLEVTAIIWSLLIIVGMWIAVHWFMKWRESDLRKMRNQNKTRTL